MEPITAIYAILGGLSLVGADSYFSSSTVHFKTTVAPAYEESGLSADLVESLMLAEFEEIIDAKSLVKAPHLLSSKDQPVSSALAHAAGLSEALEAAKSTVGVSHPELVVSVLMEKRDNKEYSRIVVAGDTEEGRKISFSVPINERPIEAALEETAFKAMLEINPYVAILHAMEVAEASSAPPLEAERLLKEELDRSSRDETDPRRAQLENLMGLIQLLLNKPKEAGYWFEKAGKSDETFVVSILNDAFIAMLQNDCAKAVERITSIVEPSYWLMTGDKVVLYAAYNTLGICLSRTGQKEAANEAFEKAGRIRPDGTSVYYYWSKSLLAEGRKQEADAMMTLAKRNVSKLDSYPEVAMMHFWAPEAGSTVLLRRMRTLPGAAAEAAPQPAQVGSVATE